MVKRFKFRKYLKPTAPSMEEVLDELSCRFLVNLPEEEFGSSERICFQAELAHWFYEDFYREKWPELPYWNFRTFCKAVFEHYPDLKKHLGPDFDQVISDFTAYKNSVPVSGAILLNPQKSKCLMVKGWNRKSPWGFPKGKINENEDFLSCSIREVQEETGFDVTLFLKEDEYIEHKTKNKITRLYVIFNVPEDTVFVPQTKKEVGDIAWHSIQNILASKDNQYGTSLPIVTKLADYIQKPKKSKRLLELILERVPTERRRALLRARMNKKADLPRSDIGHVPAPQLHLPKPAELLSFIQTPGYQLVNKSLDRSRLLKELRSRSGSLRRQRFQMPRPNFSKQKEMFLVPYNNPFDQYGDNVHNA